MTATHEFLDNLTKFIPDPTVLGRNVFVAIDGVDGSGKTTLAIRLHAHLSKIPGWAAVRSSIDGFHNPRAHRYRRGSSSPEGFWLDSYDYQAFRDKLVDPLKPGGSGLYVTNYHDVETDTYLRSEASEVDQPSVILVDGIFLHRPELRNIWDISIFLDVDFAVSVPRMAVRDRSDPDPLAASNERYVQGQRIYLHEVNPAAQANVLIDNNDLDNPRIIAARIESQNFTTRSSL